MAIHPQRRNRVAIATAVEATAMRDPAAGRTSVPGGAAALAAQFAAAPHRMMFFGGAAAVLASMLWWAGTLAAGYFGYAFPVSPIPPGWAHAVLTQYGMLSLFIFGFLLTVYPRWMNQAALGRRHYVPVFVGVFGGYLVAHAGLLGMPRLLIAGLISMLCGWWIAIAVLGRILWRNGARDRHALSCWIAILIGGIGLTGFAAYVLGAPWQLAPIAIKLATFGFLLPVYFTVCHRMIPFFSANVAGSGYRAVKPAWSLPALWLLCAAHLTLELTHHYEALWPADTLLMAFFLTHWIAWQPWKCLRPGLLSALYLAFAWLPIAFALYAAQSAMLYFNDAFVLGRAPVHALTVGFFGSMLVAMVTRVTQGHSGRPLQMGAVAWATFALLQGVVLLRIGAEVASAKPFWLLLAASGWLVAFAPWVLRSLWIYATPRADGKPG